MEQLKNKMTKAEYKKIIKEAIKEDINFYLNNKNFINIKNYEDLKEFKKTYYYKMSGFNFNLTKAKKEKSIKKYIEREIKEQVKEKFLNIQNKVFNAIEDLEIIETIEISTEWHKNPKWGWNPTSKTRISTNNNFYYYKEGASGCGYDKLSAAINSCITQNQPLKNDFIKKVFKSNEPLPYCVYFDKYGLHLELNGAGLSSVIKALEWLGFKVQTAEGKTWDYLKATKKGGKK